MTRLRAPSRSPFHGIPALWLAMVAALAAFGWAGQALPPAAPAKPGAAAASQSRPPAMTRTGQAIKTPLPQEILTLLANEVSGQMAFNNLMRLAGAPWVRDVKELKDTMSETLILHDLVRGYGIDTVKIEKYPPATPGATFDYPLEGELWTLEPEKRLLARIGADAALVSRGSKTCDVSGELIYVPALTPDEAKKIREAGSQDAYKGKLALVWGLTPDMTTALDAAGVVGVITFSAQDRYLDPDQVIYSGVSIDQSKNIKIGLAVSWRQWSELLEDVELNRKIVLRASAKVEKFPDRFEMIHAWIPGTEPDKKGVIFTSHLYEGYLKRGANDSMGGVATQLEILRALTDLVKSGALPQPRRTIHFLWPNEISGTNEFIKHNPDLAAKLSVNINMDMVGEALRKNNSLFTMGECPSFLPSFYDGLADSVLNYVWRMNDIVYLNDGPRSRYRGQNFPVPMWEKNGSRDAFRYFIHKATGGSDHVCFIVPAVGVPAIEFFTWPDQWYHTDTDTPDKADPTEMKRVAFIGAATGWAAAALPDAWAPDLADAASQYGYKRTAERDLPRAFAKLDAATGPTLAADTARSLNLVRFAVRREIGAIRSIDEIATGSPAAAAAVAARVKQWELYGEGLKSQVLGYAAVRAKALGVAAPREPKISLDRAARLVPSIAPAVRGKELSLARFEPYVKYMKEHPDALKGVTLHPQAPAMLLNFVNGRNSIADIAADAAAELDIDIPLGAATAYLQLLAAAGYIKI
ncbi:MAG: M28 family peptidase [Candidatus Aminicenantes bacterium]|nr:M28 family peptidase [Candidatus Aminicenantes bacterium]